MYEYIGYHGTNSQNVASIKANGFKPSISYNEWLGSGVYFFIEGSFCPITNARDWVISNAWDKDLKQNRYSNYSILMTVVSGNRALDLRKEEDLKLFETLRERILEKYESEKKFFSKKIHPNTFLCNSVAKSMKLDILIHNLYIKNLSQRVNYHSSFVPNTTVLCAKRNAKIDIDLIEEIETNGVNGE